jgi:hypothetical protein
MDGSNNNIFIELGNKLNTSSGSKYEVSFINEQQIYQGPCFVYGELVNDFHTIDKAHISTLLYGAVSELDNSLTPVVTKLKSKISSYETEKNILVNKVLKLEEHNSVLSADNNLLKEQLLNMEQRLKLIEERLPL